MFALVGREPGGSAAHLQRAPKPHPPPPKGDGLLGDPARWIPGLGLLRTVVGCHPAQSQEPSQDGDRKPVRKGGVEGGIQPLVAAAVEPPRSLQSILRTPCKDGTQAGEPGPPRRVSFSDTVEEQSEGPVQAGSYGSLTDPRCILAARLLFVVLVCSDAQVRATIGDGLAPAAQWLNAAWQEVDLRSLLRSLMLMGLMPLGVALQVALAAACSSTATAGREPP